MAMTANQYLAQLQALLPSGAAWTREPDADLTNAMLAIATELARIDARLDDLVNEGDVRTATELMTDWERVLGLPDDCMANTVLTLAQRRLLALQRLVEEGGQSAAYYIGLAELLGEPGCTVSEFRPMNCNDNCNSALQVYTPSLAECPIRERKPAHTQVLFTYVP
jgi:uncharacterized protein YmfQ (DUF2313 family)